jgi:RNA polymerase sigma-70 factor (ECF subfamily)
MPKHSTRTQLRLVESGGPLPSSEANPSAGVLTGHFRRAARLERDEESERLVARAVARAKQGDREALRFIYVQYADHVFGYVSSLLRDEHEAEDVTQQVFARLMTALKRYEDRGVPFSAWLLRITHNMAIDHMRRRLVLCDETTLPEDAHDDRGQELGSALREALEGMPEVQRQVLVLRHVGGFSPGEIAEELGRSEDSVHGLHHRGRRELKKRLQAVGATPMAAAA